MTSGQYITVETLYNKIRGIRKHVTCYMLHVYQYLGSTVQWNLVIKRSDITKPSYNKVILLVPALHISLFFYPDIMRNLI